MSEIKYTFEKLDEGAKTIALETEQVRSFDKQFLADACEMLASFHGDYASKALDVVSNMKDVKAERLISKLEAYSVSLSTANEIMQACETELANAYAGDTAG